MRRPALILAVSALVGCGGDGGDDGGVARPADADPQAPRSQLDAFRSDSSAESVKRVDPVPCPAELANCRSASGRILYVERVDPDGDGDAHFVLLSRQSISGPGITVVDVRRELRPNPLPEPGDALAAAGPVFRGSFGQRQIEAIDLRVRR